MNNKYLEFSEQLRTTKENEVKNKERLENGDWRAITTGLYETYKFSLCSLWNSGGNYISFTNRFSPLIELDEEDMEYFKNKYLPKIEDQYQNELREIKKKYNKDE